MQRAAAGEQRLVDENDVGAALVQLRTAAAADVAVVVSCGLADRRRAATALPANSAPSAGRAWRQRPDRGGVVAAGVGGQRIPAERTARRIPVFNFALVTGKARP